jgi:hypothetical protein
MVEERIGNQRGGQVRLVSERRGQYAERTVAERLRSCTGLKRLVNLKAVITHRLPGSGLHSVLGSRGVGRGSRSRDQEQPAVVGSGVDIGEVCIREEWVRPVRWNDSNLHNRDHTITDGVCILSTNG